MTERKFKLYCSKLDPVQKLNTQEARKNFQEIERNKKTHLSQITDRQIEDFLFSKVDNTKGNVSYLSCAFNSKLVMELIIISV